MHVSRNNLGETQIQLAINAVEEDLRPYKKAALDKLASQVKLPGFRQGKAPASLIEKNIDPQTLQTEFLDIALTELYAKAVQGEKITPLTRPEVSLKKFVPFSTLEFEVTTHIVGEVKLPNYKAITFKKPEVNVTAADVNGVISSLQTRLAEKKEVKRAAMAGDEAWIDFKGIDAKGQPINGADGQDYPLILGSKTFIPGFEENIVGMKADDEKTFTLTFPKGYGVAALASKKVTFTVKLKKVEELKKPKPDDALAAKAGPFKTLKELKDDIKRQLKIEKQREADQAYHNELVAKIVDKVGLTVPEPLVEHQINHNLEDLKRNLTYRGQTYQEFLASTGETEETYRDTILKPQAERQIKTSLVLNEIAAKENISVTPEELEIRLQILKGQYKDQAMQAELDKPENREEIYHRLQTEKIMSKLEQYANTSK